MVSRGGDNICAGVLFACGSLARDCLFVHETTFVINWEGQADERRRVNTVTRLTVVRQPVGEGAAAAFKDAFGDIV